MADDTPIDAWCVIDGEGRLIDETGIPVVDASFLRGDGLFETLRAIDGGARFARRHWDRLRRSAARLGFDAAYIADRLDDGRLDAIARYLIGNNGYDVPGASGRLRVTLSRGGHVFVDADTPRHRLLATSQPFATGDPPRPLRLATSAWRVASNGPLAGLKSTSYAAMLIAARAAAADGADDALLLNERGEVVETTRANLFFVAHDGAIATPSLASGALPGIGREVMLEAIVASGEFPPPDVRALRADDLAAFRAAFAISSLRGVVPIASIARADAQPLAFDSGDPTIRRLAERWLRAA